MVALVDNTEADLASLIGADFDRPSTTLNSPRQLMDWFHYRARLVARRPRQVTMSEAVKAELPNYAAISTIASAFREGAEISPWLSDNVRLRKDDYKADPMFGRWQISLMHLGTYFVRPAKVKRSGPLLFAHIDNNDAVLLKVIPGHTGFTDEGILAELLKTKPELMTRWELKGVLPSKDGYISE